MQISFLNCTKGIFEISIPEIKILPFNGSKILKSPFTKELFPEPVLPTIPIFSLG